MTRKLLILSFLLLFFASSAHALENATTTESAKPTAPTSSAAKLKEQMQLLQNQKTAAVSRVKDEAKTLIQTKRAEFKERIQTIKDQRKKALVERIDAKLAEVNKNHTSKFTEVINKLQAILDRVKQSATDAKVQADAAAAQTVIDSAKLAVDDQAAKAYTMTIVDDITLKANAGTTVSQLRQDLTAVHKLVIDAKQAVQKINIDRKLMKKEATTSANL